MRNCTPISRERWSAALPFTAFAANQIAITIFLKGSLREENAVPEVTENTLRHSFAEHLNRARLIS